MRYFCLRIGLSFVLLLFAMGVNAPAAEITLQNATATFSQSGCAVGRAIDGVLTDNLGWAIWRPGPSYATDAETAVFETATDVGFTGATQLTFTLDQRHSNAGHLLGRFRLSATTANRNTFANGLPTGGDVTPDTGWIMLTPTTATSRNGATLTVLSDNSILSSGFLPAQDIYTITANTSLTGITGFRLEALTDPSLPTNGPGRYWQNGNFLLTEFSVRGESVVPEPSSLVRWSSFGAIALVFAWRRRKRRLS